MNASRSVAGFGAGDGAAVWAPAGAGSVGTVARVRSARRTLARNSGGYT
jgi:hypothetical protein